MILPLLMGGKAINFIPNLYWITFWGESNSGGVADNNLASTAEKLANPNLKIYNATSGVFETFQVGVNNNTGHSGLSSIQHGIELGMNNRVVAGTFLNTPLFLTKTGQGGSIISQWDADSSSGYWNSFKTRIAYAKSYFQTNYGGMPRVFMFSSQGINDVVAGTNMTVWLNKRIAHIAKMRALIGYDFPIIEMKFMTAYASNLNVTIDTLKASVNNLDFFTTDDLATSADGNHYTYASYKIMANRFCDKVLTMV